MPVESAVDLATFFNEDEFAEGALYRPKGDTGAGTRCSVIVDRGQGRRAFTGAAVDAATIERLVQVRSDELPEIARNGTFTILDEDGNETSEVMTIAGMPKLDETGEWWVAEIVIEV